MRKQKNAEQHTRKYAHTREKENREDIETDKDNGSERNFLYSWYVLTKFEEKIQSVKTTIRKITHL